MSLVSGSAIKCLYLLLVNAYYVHFGTDQHICYCYRVSREHSMEVSRGILWSTTR